MRGTWQEIQGTESRAARRRTPCGGLALLGSPHTYIYEQKRLLTHLPTITQLLRIRGPRDRFLSQVLRSPKHDPPMTGQHSCGEGMTRVWVIQGPAWSCAWEDGHVLDSPSKPSSRWVPQLQVSRDTGSPSPTPSFFPCSCWNIAGAFPNPPWGRLLLPLGVREMDGSSLARANLYFPLWASGSLSRK